MYALIYSLYLLLLVEDTGSMLDDSSDLQFPLITLPCPSSLATNPDSVVLNVLCKAMAAWV